MKNKPKEKTPEEVRIEFLQYIHSLVHYYEYETSKTIKLNLITTIDTRIASPQTFLMIIYL